jgi:mannose-6-phosphate isomerase
MPPALLASSFKEKVWGSTHLGPWFPDSQAKIGEVWFEARPPLPLLAKFLFTEQALSVQVHPDDEYGRLHENSPGKTEMWHILRAAPGARIAMGLREPVSKERLRAAAESGEIEQLLNWVEVKPGDTFHIPAGTIHAIGGGIALCEIQQNSDITYRLYDYGRPRDLHLDRGIDVSIAAPWRPAPLPSGFIAHCDYYAVRLLDLRSPATHTPAEAGFEILIVLEGSGLIAGQSFHAGQAWHIQPVAGPFEIAPAAPARFLLASLP